MSTLKFNAVNYCLYIHDDYKSANEFMLTRLYVLHKDYNVFSQYFWIFSKYVENSKI